MKKSNILLSQSKLTEMVEKVVSKVLKEEDSQKWEQNLDIKKGALHKALGIPEGEKIPVSLIDKKIKDLQGKYDEKENMSAEDRKMLKRLVLAKTFKKQANEGVETDLTEGRPFKLGKGYTHFAIDKKTNKIINGWDYKGIDKEDLMSDKNGYFFSDLTDFVENTGTKKSDIKIVTKGALDKMGIDTSNSENWYKPSGEQVTEMNGNVVNESYEIHYSDGIRQSQKVNTLPSAIAIAKQLKNQKNMRFVDIYTSGVKNTTDDTKLVKWWGDGHYWDNVSKRNPELLNKKLTESYESDEIEKIIDPETEYGYSIVISNSGNGGNKTKYLKASKSQIEKIKQILSAGDESITEEYGDKRDYKKIEIFVKGAYVGTTTWSKNLKQAKEKFLEKNSNVKPEDVVVKFEE